MTWSINALMRRATWAILEIWMCIGMRVLTNNSDLVKLLLRDAKHDIYLHHVLSGSPYVSVIDRFNILATV